MTTKETFLSLGISDPYHETADKIDFNALDNFVSMLVVAYASRRGRQIVKEELLTDSLTETTLFLTRMIDVGTVQFLSQNGLISANEEETDKLAFVAAAGVNISMASELKREGLDQIGANIFFDIRALFGLIERVMEHISKSRTDSSYIFSLVSFNLIGLVNGNEVH